MLLKRLSSKYCLPALLSLALTGCAFGVEGCGGGTTSGSTAPAAIQVTVSGASAVRLGSTAQFVAAVSNTQNQTVTWQVNGVSGGSSNAGTISASGLYTAPLALASGAISVTAVSQASPSASGSASLTLQNPLPVAASATASEVGTTLNYSIDVKGAGFVPASTILVNGAVQASTYVSGGELTCAYTVALGSTSLTVAVVNPDPGGSTSAALNVPLSISSVVTVSGPATVTLGANAQFSAAVTNSVSQNVTWQVNGVSGGSATVGTISASGLYTAPQALPTPNTVSIKAVSSSNPSISGTAAIAVQNPLPVLSTATATQVGTTLAFVVDAKGSGFQPSSVITVAGSAQSTTYVSANELTATTTVAYNAAALAIAVNTASPGGGTSATLNVSITISTDAATAGRLLDQATFGPTVSDIQHVQSIGVDAYLAEQFKQTPSNIPNFLAPLTQRPAYCQPPVDTNSCVNSPWWQNAVTGSDQLRQRVTFALAQLFVVSQLGKTSDPLGLPLYQNTLQADAFTNFYTIMSDVAKSVPMGEYLNMLNSAKPVTGAIANENFAREEMQLFTLGLNLLNPDGTITLDGSGNPISTYTEAQVQAFARAYTGWTYANATGGSPAVFPNTTTNYLAPMAPVESQHDTTSKALLNGTVLPAGQTSAQDLDGALTNIFQHQNIAPFISKQLIQHLVTSTPSAAYVKRVAAVFADNGSGVRGDMQAILRAIFEDAEARAGDTNTAFDGGHLREPTLFLTAAVRGLGAVNNSSSGIWYSLESASGNLGESPYQSTSVFNFFPPDYAIPISNINAPEFGIENTATVTLRQTLVNTIVFNNLPNFTIDLSATSPLGVMSANAATLVDYLGMLFMHSQMPDAMRTAIINELNTITNNPAKRARIAVYLVLSSPQYKVIH